MNRTGPTLHAAMLAVLRRSSRPLSAADLGRAVGCSRAVATAVLHRLLANRVVRRVAGSHRAHGRPAAAWELRSIRREAA